MLRFELSNGTALEIRVDLTAVTITQSWPTGQKQVVTVPLPDVKEIASKVRSLVRFFI